MTVSDADDLLASGIAIFTAASAGAALATSVLALDIARALQRFGGAIVMPLTLTVLSAAVPEERRGVALGIWGGISGLAVAVGPLVGGAIVSGISWHWVFWLNVPIGVALVPFILLRLEETRGPVSKLDLLGLALGSAGLVGIVWALIRANDDGWTAPRIIGAFILGGARPQEEGQASGANNALRELGGVFGVAVLAAVFTANGGYRSGQQFVDGMDPAVLIGAVLVAVGALAAFAIKRAPQRTHAGLSADVPLITACACASCWCTQPSNHAATRHQHRHEAETHQPSRHPSRSRLDHRPLQRPTARKPMAAPKSGRARHYIRLDAGPRLKLRCATERTNSGP